MVNYLLFGFFKISVFAFLYDNVMGSVIAFRCTHLSMTNLYTIIFCIVNVVIRSLASSSFLSLILKILVKKFLPFGQLAGQGNLLNL